jgi:phosphohistidine phosphatase SixA
MKNTLSKGSKKKYQTYRRYSIFVMVTATFILISTSSALSIYANRGVLKAGFERVFRDKPVISYRAQDEVKDKFWAKQVLKGGFILHFRHAERDKWLDVELYDLLETKPQSNGVNQTAIGEEKFYKNAVCLNNRGLVQARAMGQIIRDLGLPTNMVISSPSCRARQTAELTFGGYDQLDLRLLHQGVFTENKDQYVSSLSKLYKSFDTSKNKNVIISAHNGVVTSEMFINGQNFAEEFFSLEEGGFYIISNLSSGLKLQYKFTNFKDFAKQNYAR